MLLVNSSQLRKVAILQRFFERAYSFRLQYPKEGLQISDDLIAWTKADPSPLVAVLRGRALMERGNFLRILGEPAGARAALAEALRELEAEGTGDPLELARYQELLGTLERDCGHHKAAVDLLRKALAKVRRWGDNYTLQRVLIATGLTELYNNNFEQADNLLGEGLRCEEPDSLFLRYAAINRVMGYFFSGDPHKAYQVFLRVRSCLGASWLQGFPEASQVSVVWREGQILNALHVDDDAIGLLRKAREGFIRLARGHEVCHISIELALNYAARQLFDEVRRELAFALPFCSPRRALDKYAREAVLLLLGALQHQGRLEADQVRAVARRLDCIDRAPFQALSRPPFADLQL